MRIQALTGVGVASTAPGTAGDLKRCEQALLWGGQRLALLLGGGCLSGAMKVKNARSSDPALPLRGVQLTLAQRQTGSRPVEGALSLWFMAV